MALVHETTDLPPEVARRLALIHEHNNNNNAKTSNPSPSKVEKKKEEEKTAPEGEKLKSKSAGAGECLICGIAYSKFPQHMPSHHELTPEWYDEAEKLGLEASSEMSLSILRRKTPLRLAIHRILQNYGGFVNALEAIRDSGATADVVQLLEQGLRILEEQREALEREGRFGVASRSRTEKKSGGESSPTPGPSSGSERKRKRTPASGKRAGSSSDCSSSPDAHDPSGVDEPSSSDLDRPSKRTKKSGAAAKGKKRVAPVPMEIVHESGVLSDPELVFGEFQNPPTRKPALKKKSSGTSVPEEGARKTGNPGSDKNGAHRPRKPVDGALSVSGRSCVPALPADEPKPSSGMGKFSVPGLNITVQSSDDGTGSVAGYLIYEHLLQLGADNQTCPKEGVPISSTAVHALSLEDLVDLASRFETKSYFKVGKNGVRFHWSGVFKDAGGSLPVPFK